MKPDSLDVRSVIDDLMVHVGTLPDASWDEFAHNLTWTRREAIGHLCDDLVFYAMQIAGNQPPQTSYVEFLEPPAWREGGLQVVLYPDPDTGTRGAVGCLDAAGGVLTAVVASVPASRRGFHPAGISDASGFAAMGIAEAVLHGYDILAVADDGGEVSTGGYRPDGTIVARVLDRIFPDAARTDDAWADLLRATGRHAESESTNWRWNSEVR
ncbi:hypothetical protein [Leifsonia sp. A12D58]|uniref:hypothetical protein n=1 Tax=Leifsonia sp. A12D58 TaxID=3397674 RepID=UPI0039E164CA